MKEKIKKFEYKIVIGDHRPEKDESMLNDLGREGWEVTAISTTRIAESREFVGRVRTLYWFKRELREREEEEIEEEY